MQDDSHELIHNSRQLAVHDHVHLLRWRRQASHGQPIQVRLLVVQILRLRGTMGDCNNHTAQFSVQAICEMEQCLWRTIASCRPLSSNAYDEPKCSSWTGEASDASPLRKLRTSTLSTLHIYVNNIWGRICRLCRPPHPQCSAFALYHDGAPAIDRQANCPTCGVSIHYSASTPWRSKIGES